jgi:hypothetical protein
MARKSNPDQASRYSGWFLKGAVPLVLVILLLGSLIWAGRWGLEQIRGSDRYLVAFADIQCDPPPGLTKADFLDEVQYLSRLPKTLSLVDEKLQPQLREGFALHPWVAKVDDVEINPPKQIVIRMTYRKEPLRKFKK